MKNLYWSGFKRNLSISTWLVFTITTMSAKLHTRYFSNSLDSFNANGVAGLAQHWFRFILNWTPINNIVWILHKRIIVCSRKCNWKCPLRNTDNLVSAQMKNTTMYNIRNHICKFRIWQQLSYNDTSDQAKLQQKAWFVWPYIAWMSFSLYQNQLQYIPSIMLAVWAFVILSYDLLRICFPMIIRVTALTLK